MESAAIPAIDSTHASGHSPDAARLLPELLAPAGDWECAKAAVENGADAIYFGLDKFNARMRAHNFTEADLPSLMDYLHRRGVKGYVTFNTLVFENELAQAEQYLRTMIAAGVDAAIVQDVGICRLIRRLSADFPIHVSTQMTITSAAGVEFARELGCNLVVLARECSLKEISRMVPSDACRVTSDTEPPADTASLAARHLSLPIEVFVHGALCVAYSGQCLTSEALGGRSANRGECAQACRMPYELICDGKPVPLGDRKYLLSPQDLAGLQVLPELVRLGVASLKIEGRLKSPEYVANITHVYRHALDALDFSRIMQPAAPTLRAKAGRASPPSVTSGFQPVADDTSATTYNLEMAFSRGLYTGWFEGVNNQKLVHARFGKKRGVYLGEVLAVEKNRVRVRLSAPLKPGDGIVFDAGKPEEQEEGGRVYELETEPRHARRKSAGQSALSPNGIVLLWFGKGDINFSRVHAGDKVWKTSDPELDRRLRRSFEGDKPKFRRPLSFEVHGLAGAPLTLIARDGLGHVVQLSSAMPLAVAEKQPLTSAALASQLRRLGDTAFELRELTNRLERQLMLPISELNRLRREAVRALERLRAQPKRWRLEPARTVETPALSVSNLGTGKAELIVLVRTLAQLDAALDARVRTIYCDFEDPKKYRDAVQTFRNSSTRKANAEIFVTPPRIFKMGEEWTLKLVRSSEADGYLVRNYDHLKFFGGERRVGDFSLNISNHLSAEYFKNRFDLERMTASYDLNFTQLEALLRGAPPEWFEVTIHQHMPMFHMEHCVFCAFLSSGTDYTNCGRPCDKHDLKLRDRVGLEHPVKADVGCRNTVFNGLAQTGAEYVAKMLALGVRHFRIEFVNETPRQAAQTISKYRELLDGRITGSELWKELQLLNQLGVTRGQMGAVERG
jgi:putative protease